MNRDNNPLICFVVILGASLRGIWGEYLSFRNLIGRKSVRKRQTADYQIVMRFFSCLILSIQDRNQTKKRPHQTEFWH